jgi:hypothetical protein
MDQFGDVGRLSRTIPNDSLYGLAKELPLKWKAMLGQTCRGASPAMKLACKQHFMETQFRLISVALENSLFTTCDSLIKKKLQEIEILYYYRLWEDVTTPDLRGMLIQKANGDDEENPPFYAFRNRKYITIQDNVPKVLCSLLHHRYGDDMESCVPDMYVEFTIRMTSPDADGAYDTLIAYDVSVDDQKLEQSPFIMPMHKIKAMLALKGKGEWCFANQNNQPIPLDHVLRGCVSHLLKSVWV